MRLFWNLLRELWNNDAWEVSLYNLNWTYGQTHQCPPGGAIIPQQVYQPFLLCLVRPVGSPLPLPEGCWQRANLQCGLLGTNHVRSGDPWCFDCTEPSATFLQHTSIILGHKWLGGGPRLTCLLVSSRINPFLQGVSIPLQRILNPLRHTMSTFISKRKNLLSAFGIPHK